MWRVLLTALAFVLSAAFAWLAWKPWVPEAHQLRREPAVVTEIVDLSGGQDTTTFRTNSGALVKLICGRRKTCHKSQMEALKAAGAATVLGHYHGTVYEIEAPEQELQVTLADAKLEWRFPTALSVVLLGAGLYLLLAPPPKPQCRHGKPARRRRRSSGRDSSFNDNDDSGSGDSSASDDD